MLAHKDDDIHFLKSWYLINLEFDHYLLSLETNDTLSKLEEYTSLLKDHIKEAKKTKYSKRALLSAFNDMYERYTHMPCEHKKSLNELLKIKLGKNFDDYSFSIAVKKITQTGKINTEEEYRIILSEVDRLSQIEPDSDALKNLNKLLLDFHVKA